MVYTFLKNSILPVVVLALLMPSCALLDPDAPLEAKYFEAQETYIAVVSTLIDLRTAGKINQTKWVEDIYPLIKEGDELLDRMEAQIALGGLSVSNLLLKSFINILTRLQTEAL